MADGTGIYQQEIQKLVPREQLLPRLWRRLCEFQQWDGTTSKCELHEHLGSLSGVAKVCVLEYDAALLG
jgi:hypothetical protein